MITHELMGGLGNQLFQIATTIALGLRNSHSFVFDYTCTSTKGITFRTTYWNTLLKYCQSTSTSCIHSNMMSQERQHMILSHYDHHYRMLDHDIPIHMEDTTIMIQLEGYFQSYKYFEQEKKEIFRIWHLKEQQEDMATQYPMLLQPHTICMHFRMGDYRHLVHIHPILHWTYYQQSLHTILQDIPSCSSTPIMVYYFCEEIDIFDVQNTIQQLETEFPSCSFCRMKGKTDWQELLMMSLCQHYIIANSSFSWWGAYMSREYHPKKENILDEQDTKDIYRSDISSSIVCYPSIWFGKDAQHHQMDDMFPSSWICIETINIW
jgi:Glycosyl transferase family 11